MKNILLSLLLITSLSAIAKKEKPEPAFKKGYVTATVAAGYPNFIRYSRVQSGSRSVGPFMAAVDYQASRRFSFGLQYTYQYTSSGIQSELAYVSTGTSATFSYEYQYVRKVTYHSLMATVDYCFLNRGRVSLSSGIGLGYAPRPKLTQYFSDNIDHSDKLGRVFTNALPAVRLRLAYAKVRVKENFGVCGGIGLGTDGVFSLGVHYTFNGKNNQ